MKLFSRTILSTTLPLLLLSACGGGGSGSTTPQIGAAVPDESTDSPSISNLVNGRVADGYIRGATVCVDTNENGACDADDPAVLSVAGGSFSLEVPPAHSDKPIIASIPADAIDEDTGEAVGKDLVLSTPPDRPEFISPITTLVHEELKNNPALSTSDAESAVREELGLADEADASLFADYVARQRDNDNEEADRYRFLHQTARVVASMMDDIQATVMSAATDGGMDVSGDEIAREAIRRLVRQEVRDLLPDIARMVAQRVAEHAAQTESTEPASIVEEVDPAELVESLRPDDLDVEVVEQIEAISNEAEVRRVAMEELLKEGIYWLEVDCEDHGEDCEAEYGQFSVSGADNTFNQVNYEFDPDTAAWILQQDYEDDYHFAWILKEGEWVKPAHGDSPGTVEFLEDGGALFTGEEGKTLVYASQRDLQNTSVRYHLRKREAPPEVLALVDEAALFPEGSAAQHLHIRRHTQAPVLFNWAPDDSGDDAAGCELFGGNCNVVQTHDENGMQALLTLDEVREGSINGIQIEGFSHDRHLRRPLHIMLSVATEPVIDTEKRVALENVAELPSEGTVTWKLGDYYYGPGGHEPVECQPEGEQPVPYEPDLNSMGIDGVTGVENPDSHLFESVQAYAGIEAAEVEHVIEEYIDDCFEPHKQPVNDAVVTEATATSSETDKPVDGEQPPEYAFSRWSLTSVEGVSMIKIGIPIAVKHGLDIDDASAMLLIEHDGFVRRGAILSDSAASDELTYSLAAFETLEAVVRAYLTR